MNCYNYMRCKIKDSLLVHYKYKGFKTTLGSNPIQPFTFNKKQYFRAHWPEYNLQKVGLGFYKISDP
jgi:hypothetical protein